jgi:DNA modification methylase
MIKFIHYHDITIPSERQRKTFDLEAGQDLAASISDIGLLSPIILSAGTILVAGERRTRAISDIYDLGGRISFGGSVLDPGMVPFIDLGDLDPITAKTVELDENIKRLDLTWQDRTRATAELMELKRLIAQRDDLPPPTYEDLAKELHDIPRRIDVANTREDVLLAKHLENPLIAKAKTAREAFAILRKEEKDRENKDYGERLAGGLETLTHKLVQANCVDWLESQPDEQFAVICTDPPYGMDAHEFGDAGQAGSFGEHGYEDSADNLLELIGLLPAELFRVAMKDAHLYLFCDIDMFHVWEDALKAAGWRVHRTPLIWYKPSAFRCPWPDYGPQRKYELILYAIKGSRETNMLKGDVLTIPPDPNLGHHAQKPVELFAELLARSVRPGETVLDPFCGSGPIFPAAHGLKCKAVGIELDTRFIGIAGKRIEELK